MTNRDPKYLCLVCVEWNRMRPTRGLRAISERPVLFRRVGKHSNHRHPGRVRFEPAGTVA